MNEDANDKVPPISTNQSGSSTHTSVSIGLNDIELSNNNNMNRVGSPSNAVLQRTRSKSMGSFAEMDITGNKLLSPTSPGHSMGDEYKSNHNMARSGDNLHNIHKRVQQQQMQTPISSPIYKDLAEMSKKLTFITFGPSRRPTHGNIHCVLKVETNDMKGQCCIPFKWDDFANEVENTQFVELFHHGVPLYDKTNEPVRLKVHYKLSLIDKQIVFDYH